MQLNANNVQDRNNLHTVNSRYLKFQGTVKNSLRYPKFEISEFKDSLVMTETPCYTSVSAIVN